jgi:hypothetical protein
MTWSGLTWCQWHCVFPIQAELWCYPSHPDLFLCFRISISCSDALIGWLSLVIGRFRGCVGDGSQGWTEADSAPDSDLSIWNIHNYVKIDNRFNPIQHSVSITNFVIRSSSKGYHARWFPAS